MSESIYLHEDATTKPSKANLESIQKAVDALYQINPDDKEKAILEINGYLKQLGGYISFVKEEKEKLMRNQERLEKTIKSYKDFYTKFYNVIRDFSHKILEGTNDSLELKRIKEEIEKNNKFEKTITALLNKLEKKKVEFMGYLRERKKNISDLTLSKLYEDSSSVDPSAVF